MTGGASYYLSRLPFEIGTYLALTGNTLRGRDIVRAGIAKGILVDDGNSIDELRNIQMRFDDDVSSETFYGDQTFKNNYLSGEV